MRIVFFGTPEYVLPVVEKLNLRFKTKDPFDGLVAVVTQPPRPFGRKKLLKYSSIDKWAHKKHKQIIYDLQEVPEADLGVVASYGKIIPKNVIDRFKYGVLNIHPSLLPKYRGASPIQEALKNADKVTGLSIIKMDEKMDHGPIVSFFEEKILETDNAETLRYRLFEKSAEFLINLIPSYISGKVKLSDQKESDASFSKMIKKEDGYIDPIQLIKDPERSLSLIKAMYPWPGVWTIVDDKRIKIIEAHKENKYLKIDQLQMESKNPVKWSQFKQAYPEIAKKLSS